MLQVACGIDVHKKQLTSTITSDASKETREFEATGEGLEELKDWLRDHKCRDIALESTGVLWAPIYFALEENFHLVLANAYQVKSIPGRKTDQSDSEWLAQLLRCGLIKPSYIPEKPLRTLRELTRARVKLVNARTGFKNQIHQILDRTNMKLSSVLSDIFGKAGRTVLEGFTQGRSIESIIDTSGSRLLKKRREEVKTAVKGALDETDIFILKELLDLIDRLDEKIKHLDARILSLTDEKKSRILKSIPGIGDVAAPSILAEIGDAKRFENGKKISSYFGLAPSVYQSAGRATTGKITKHGSSWLRRVMVECAMIALKARNSRLRLFYLRVKARGGHKKAVIALARKLLCITHHLLVNEETYVEDNFNKKHRRLKSSLIEKTQLNEMAQILRRAGYVVTPPY